MSHLFEAYLPSGKHTKNYRKSRLFMGKHKLYMVIFNFANCEFIQFIPLSLRPKNKQITN